MMLKKILLILLTVVLVIACFTMTACKETPTYTVSFDSAGGTLVEQQKVKEGSKASKPENPTKVGYEFDDWYLGEEQTPFDFEKTSIKKNTTLTAKWNVNQYSISFDTDGGEPATIHTITQDFDTVVSAPADPIKTGYTFSGWFEDGSLTAYVFDKIEARDVELKAKWTINEYTISFDSDGGSIIEDITKTYGENVEKPLDPTKTGYTFMGWFEANSVLQYEFDTMESRNVELKAGWKINKYSISFDTDGGEPATIDTITQNFDTAVSAPTQPTKTGYTFSGWFEDGSLNAYVFDKIEARNVELKAKWTINQYSISFDTDGGEPATINTITQDYNTVVIAPTKPTKVGYNFLGWFEDGSLNAYVFSTMEARNVELKAKWGEAQEYSITFDSDGGTPVATIIERVGLPVSAPAEPTKTGYTFSGWFEEGSLNAYVFSTMEERNVELKAKWTINQYSITFDADGGSVVETITQDYGTEVIAPANPTKDGHVFIGWFEENSILPYEFDTIEARNVELKARWGEIRGVITLDKNKDGQLVIGFTQGTLTPYVGQEIIIPEIECWGYKFLGWKNLSTGEMLEKVDGEYKIIHDGNDVEYQAQWEKIYQGSDTV